MEQGGHSVPTRYPTSWDKQWGDSSPSSTYPSTCDIQWETSASNSTYPSSWGTQWQISASNSTYPSSWGTQWEDSSSSFRLRADSPRADPPRRDSRSPGDPARTRTHGQDSSRQYDRMIYHEKLDPAKIQDLKNTIIGNYHSAHPEKLTLRHLQNRRKHVHIVTVRNRPAIGADTISFIPIFRAVLVVTPPGASPPSEGEEPRTRGEILAAGAWQDTRLEALDDLRRATA